MNILAGVLTGVRACAFAALSASTTLAAHATGPSPLDARSHAHDPSYTSDFGDEFVDLSAALPWKERFAPDGSFNDITPRDAGVNVSSADTASTNTPVDAPGEFDARGIVKDIRVDAGKIKIDHGPIQGLGMPAMTMLFNVREPGLLEAVRIDDEIEFDVEHTGAGMVLTRLRRAGATR